MLKFVTAAIVSASIALAAIPQQAQAGGRGVALGVGLGVGAALLMHSAHKSHQANRRRQAAHRRAAARKAAARKAAARKAAARNAAIAKKKESARLAAIAAKKREAALQAEIEREKAQKLASIIELPGRKPAARKVAKAEVETEDEYDTAADNEETSELQTVSLKGDGGSGLDCKRYIPSAGLTISVPCGQ